MSTLLADAPATGAPSKFGAVLRATAGNFLEMFDFFLFGLYAAPIGRTFFATGDEFPDTAIALIVFWLGALMRPLGAIYLGAYVDSLGRRKGLIVTLAIMAVGTVIIAFTPSYGPSASPRRSSSCSAGCCRASPPASSSAASRSISRRSPRQAREGSSPRSNRRASRSRYSSARVIGFVIRPCSPEAIVAWGWRIPFLIGCLIVPLIFLLRGSLQETPEFLASKAIRRRAEIYAVRRRQSPTSSRSA